MTIPEPTHPVLATNFLRAIHRLDSAISVFNCAVFPSKPAVAHLAESELLLGRPERVLNLRPIMTLGGITPKQRLTMAAWVCF